MKKYKDLKKATERVQIEVPSDYEEDANEFITKASAAHRAGKDKFMMGGKVYPVTIKKPVKTEAKDPPFDPDPPRKNPPAKAGKYGLGPSIAKHLAKKGMSGQTKKEDMYSSDMEMGKDNKVHPRHRINFHNSGTDAERQKQKDEKEKAKKRGDEMEESMARKALSRMMQDKSNVKTVRIPSPAERRAEMEKQKQMKKEEVESIEEKMDLAKTDMGDVIKDFQKSDAPQFKGKSKEKKREMAIAAKLGAEREEGMREEVDTGEYGARKTTPSSKEKNDDVFRRHRERMKAMKAKEASVKKEDYDMPSFTEYLKEYEYDKGRPGVVTHKGSYGTSYNSDDKDAPKKPAEPAVKRGRGRPVGSKSGANQKVTAKKSYGGIAHHTLNLPNSNR